MNGKRELVVGMARSGVAMAQLLVKHGYQVTVNDSKTAEALGDAIEPLKALPVDFRLGCPAGDVLDGIDEMIISPGISIDAGFVKKAAAAGIHVTGELEMASRLAPGELCAVTGTNGKTTTVSLLGEMFRADGRRSFCVGNIGYPYSAAGLESREDDVMVCEVSSFQMETAETFHPKAAALLNITEDHLNRHGTMEVYTAMKMRIFQNQTEEDTAVFNDDDPALLPLIHQVRSRVMTFSRLHEVEQGAFVRDGMVMLRMNGTETEVLPANEIYIPGPHNLENAMAAVCVAAAMGVGMEAIRTTLREFKGVEHRIEYTRTLDGVVYYNDSKGTNVDSTIKAVQTMTRPTAIILGGYDKHCDFTPLAMEMVKSPCIREAVLLGATADQIENALRKCGYTAIHRTGSLEEAVNTCRKLADDGWNVLFSPACASFDMFSDYEQRGRIFKELVRALV